MGFLGCIKKRKKKSVIVHGTQNMIRFVQQVAI